jgi:hypothetical protein
MTRQGERRHEGRINILDVIRIDRDRLASQFNRLIILRPLDHQHAAAFKLDQARAEGDLDPGGAARCLRIAMRAPETTPAVVRLSPNSVSAESALPSLAELPRTPVVTSFPK